MSPTPHTPRWLRPFQRVTSQGGHVREIDGLRFIALAMVVLLHLNHYVVLDATVDLRPDPATSVLGRLLDQGDFGVQVFFAISGFILSVPFARRHSGRHVLHDLPLSPRDHLGDESAYHPLVAGGVLSSELRASRPGHFACGADHLHGALPPHREALHALAALAAAGCRAGHLSQLLQRI